MPDATSIWSVNPIALAQLLTTDGPFPDDDWSQAEAALVKMFQVEDALQIFEGNGMKPGALHLLQELAATPNDLKSLSNTVELPLVRRAIERFHIPPDRVPQVVPYLLPVADAVFATPGGPAPPQVPGQYHEIPGDTEDDASFLDPVQGLAIDCYLISAMIALAWSRPGEWAAHVNAAVDRSVSPARYRYTFHDGPDAAARSLEVAPRLPQANGRYVYAHSRGRSGAWVGMLEKAYVMRRRNLTVDPAPLDYQSISDRRCEPHVACQMLWGGVCDSRRRFRAEPLATVKECCESASRLVTNVPTMAWTFDREAWEHLDFLKDMGWKRTGLVAQHAYAVLGIMKWNNTDHVVLRNPWGLSPMRAEGYATGTWKPGDGASGAAEVELNRKGVFAIPADWFNRCFAEVGWVTA